MDKIAVVIPAYKVKDKILDVISLIDKSVSRIYVVDDKCPMNSGAYVQEKCKDNRVVVLFNDKNLGVGGATKVGFMQAYLDGFDVAVKIDGDGQMDPRLLPKIVKPCISCEADYSKGNRFYRLESLKDMPFIRLVGNAALSFITKASSGYWNLMDPTNGYVAIKLSVLNSLPLDKINDRYFFESDMLFRLNTIKAVVKEVPMDAVYRDETSNLKIGKSIFEFAFNHVICFYKRIFYNYFLRDFGIFSIELIFGLAFIIFGVLFGSYHWIQGNLIQVPSSSGTVMIAALPIILGFQLLLSCIIIDIQNIPKDVLSR